MDWIKVEDNLPDNNMKDILFVILTPNNKQIMYLGNYDCDEGFITGGGDWEIFFNMPDFISYGTGYCKEEETQENAYRVTHWKYPEYPKNNEE